ncbi:MAG: DivIVA domain-containing protein [Acidimicrobiia bacterium]
MDVTPQELRGSEIKEAWRGFNRDEVDDLLERAAATIENLTRQVQEFESRAPSDSDALPTNRDDAEMLQRTLLLAQRAADDAVNEAQTHARQLIEESEARAQALVGEAEATARRIAEGERRRLEDEIQDLARRRDQLETDADALELYAAGYRDRLRAAIESDLERLGRDTIEAPSPRPKLHDVEPPTERVERAPEPERDSAVWEVERTPGPEREPVPERTPKPRVAPASVIEARPSETEWPPPADAAPSSASVMAPARGGASAAAAQAPGAQASASWLSDVEPTSEPPVDAAAPWEHATAEHQPYAADTPIEATAVEADDDLDDDAFFASLREAVRDDAPLGPREEQSPFFDDEPVDERRSHFRRRR